MEKYCDYIIDEISYLITTRPSLQFIKFVCSITTPHTLRATCSRSKNFEESSLKFHDSQFAHSLPSWPISFQKRCLFINTFDSIDIVSSLLRDKGMREKNPRDGINVNRNEIRLIKGAAVLSEGEDCGGLLRTVSSFNSL